MGLYATSSRTSRILSEAQRLAVSALALNLGSVRWLSPLSAVICLDLERAESTICAASEMSSGKASGGELGSSSTAMADSIGEASFLASGVAASSVEGPVDSSAFGGHVLVCRSLSSMIFNN